MVLDGVWGNSESVGIGDAFAISLIAILIVFLVLIIIILATSLVEKGSKFLLSKTTIMPKRENEILERDDDAVVAVLVATIEFHKQTGKSPRVKSITKVED